MTNPENMTDEQLAEAVAKEVLGGTVTEFGWVMLPNGLGEMSDDMILDHRGRDIIEDELERRGWGVQITLGDGAAVDIIKATLPNGDHHGAYCYHQNKYRALAEAALEAVRKEKS